MKEDRKEIFLKHQAQTTSTPMGLNVERAEGSYIYTVDGKRYLDMIAGIAVSNVGHNHPRVVQAVKNQVDQHMHVMVYGEYIQTAQTELTSLLLAQLPQTLDTVYYVNSGTEANEGALKLAKRVTGRSEILSCHGAYHGSTHGSLSVSGNEYKKYAFRPLLPGVKHIPFGDESALEQITTETACFILEPIQGDAGIRIPTQAYLQRVRQRCDETGTLLIFDEIQTGFGRTGKLFAFEHYDVVPDILTIAKGMGGGMPIGAFVARQELMNQLTFDPMLGHITTFGGHPVNCAAAKANLDVILEENLLESVEAKGALLEKLLQHDKVIEIRRKGLMFAIEMKDFETVYAVVQKALEQGVIGFWFLSCPNSFRLSPPLNISEQELKEATQVIQAAFDSAP